MCKVTMWCKRERDWVMYCFEFADEYWYLPKMGISNYDKDYL